MARDGEEWIERGAGEIAMRLEREIEALVAVSSPSGDRAGAEEAIAVATALLPAEAAIERPACSCSVTSTRLSRTRSTARSRASTAGSSAPARST